MMKKWMLCAAIGALALAACQPKAADEADLNAETSQSETASITAENEPEMTDMEGLAAAAEEARVYLRANAERDGVITLPSGLQYQINESGDASGTSPNVDAGQMVRVHYEGRLADGTVFDSSYERGVPAEFPSNRLIPAWVEALSLMKPGDAWTLYVPPELGYGVKGARDQEGTVIIPPNAVLIFRMELIENL